VRFFPLTEIQVSPNRQRREFDPDALADLAENIALTGLQHAVVVRDTDSGPVLVSGERRLRAIQSLYEFGVTFRYDGKKLALDQVPTVTLGELSAEEAFEAELSENILRVDLTWQERDAAIAQLHEFRGIQARARGEVQTFKATATEVAASTGTPLPQSPAAGIAVVSRSVVVAKHLDDPEVRAAKSSTEALKIIEKKAKERHNVRLAQEIGPRTTRERYMLIQGEALATMAGLASGGFDVVCTDPPYGINAQDFGSQSFLGHKYDDSPEAWLRLMATCTREWWRLTKPEAHIYVFCDMRNFFALGQLMVSAGFDVWPTPLIWYKSNGMLPRPDHGPRRCYEAVLYALKGNKRVNGIYQDVLQVPAVQTKEYAPQKPTGVYVDLLRRSVKPGDQVLDCFAGSGTIFEAAQQLYLFATGIEIDPAAYGIAYRRLEALR
jgi:site-specific DNA-methyltransferase (adenine-specific)